MPRIKILCKRWDEKTGDTYVTHLTGDVIDVDDNNAERLIRVGAAERTRAKLTNPATDKSKAKEPEAPKQPEEPAIPDYSDADEDQAPEPATEDLEDAEQDTAGTVDKPKKSATKEQWEAYAIDQGMDEDEAATASRADLVAQFA